MYIYKLRNDVEGKCDFEIYDNWSNETVLSFKK